MKSIIPCAERVRSSSVCVRAFRGSLRFCGKFLLVVMCISGLFGLVPMTRALFGSNEGSENKQITVQSTKAPQTEYVEITSLYRSVPTVTDPAQLPLSGKDTERTGLGTRDLSSVVPVNDGEKEVEPGSLLAALTSEEGGVELSDDSESVGSLPPRLNCKPGSVPTEDLPVVLQQKSKHKMVGVPLAASDLKDSPDARTGFIRSIRAGEWNVRIGEKDVDVIDWHSENLRRAAYRMFRSVVLVYDNSKVVGCGFCVEIERRLCVLTCEHVLDACKNPVFVLPDDYIVKPSQTFSCRDYDVAVGVLSDDEETLKTHMLAPCELADCSELQICDGVLAIGAPYGLRDRTTFGRVSHPSRFYSDFQDYDPHKRGKLVEYVELDMFGENGSSGGPVFNPDGAVLGIYVALMGKKIGLMVPISTALQVAQTMLEYGEWIPTEIVGASEKSFEDVRVRGYAKTEVQVVRPVGQALKVGDVVLKFKGEDVNKLDNLKRMIELSLPGSAQIEIRRGSEILQVDVELAKGSARRVQ